MEYGILEGLVRGTQSLAFYHEVTGSAVSSVSTGNILNGDEDGWYTIIVRGIWAGTNDGIFIRPNGDSGSNYGHRSIYASNTSVGDQNSTTSTGFIAGANGSSGSSTFSITRLYAKSGSVRLANSKVVTYINGTTITEHWERGQVWSNTADNIASMTIAHAQTNGLGVGTVIIVLKDNNFTDGTPTGNITTPYIKGAWVRVGSQILSSPTSSISFTGLDGDRDVLYYLSSSFKANGATGSVQLKPNNDDSNCGYQFLSGINTTVAAGRGTSLLYLGSSSTNAYISTQSTLMFAKQGFVRPMLTRAINNINGTTVTDMYMLGQSYSITNTNLTSLVIVAWANNFDTGSQFDLYALRPNG